MAKIIIDSRIKQAVDKANAAAASFSLSGAASSGFIKAESAVDPVTGTALANGDILFYTVAADAMSETGWGVVDTTAHTITRNVISTISSGTRGTTKLDFSGATDTPSMICDYSAIQAMSAQNNQRRGPAGVRLTLTQGTAVTTSDVTGATSIYAEPMPGMGSAVPLFLDSAGTVPFTPKLPASTVSKAIGTLASATIPQRVYLDFGVTSAGVFSLTFEAWTNTTTPATTPQVIDGYEYKSTDARFLWVGDFAPTSTTTTADAIAARMLWNYHNRVDRKTRVQYATSHTYAANTTRQMDGSSANQFTYMLGKPQDAIINVQSAVGSGSTNFPTVSAAVDSTTTETIINSPATPGSISQQGAADVLTLAIGSHYISMNERAGAGTSCTFCAYNNPCSVSTILVM